MNAFSFVLHVGPMKTATTYTQYILEKNRGELEEKGWIYPGRRSNQQHAFYGLCGADIPWVDLRSAEKYRGLGDSLKQILHSSSRNIVVSSEALGSLTESGIDRLLSMIPTPSRIVFTIRPLRTTLLSGWQQSLKSGASFTLSDFVRAALGEIEIGSKQEIARTYLYGDAVRRWRSASGCDVRVAEVPTRSSDPDATWQVFRSAAGLPELSNRDVPLSSANLSLSSDAAELLRRFNQNFIAPGNLRIERQREFVYNCLLAEPRLRLGDEKIFLGEGLVNQVELLEKEQRAMVHQYATEVIG